MSAVPIIDAHHHVWDIGRNYHPWLRDEPMIPFRYGSYAALRRNYLPADYRADTKRFDVRATVYVEAEWDPNDPIGETRWVHEVAEREGLPNAMVAQAWLDRADAAEVLATQAAFPLVRSIRHKPRAALSPAGAGRGEPGSMDCAAWRAGYAHLEHHGLHFDLQTPWWHFEAAAALARDFPRTLIIINHTGLPADRSPEGIAGWRRALELMAREPNTCLKISGLGTRDKGWSVASNGQVVRDAITIFGPSRSMFASNFPVDSLVATFDEIFEAFDAFSAELDERTRHLLFHDTAAQVYRPVMPQHNSCNNNCNGSSQRARIDHEEEAS